MESDKLFAQEVVKRLEPLKDFIARPQLAAILAGTAGEEAPFFLGLIDTLDQRFATMPATYGQEGAGDNALVYLHYFAGGSDWWITEKDAEGNGTEQAFGYACLNGDAEMAEMGYISIAELVAHGVELDLYWTPVPLGDIKRRLGR